MNQFDWVFERFREFGQKPFLIFHGKHYLYSDIDVEIARWQSVIETHQVQAGQSIAIVGDYSPNTIFLILALVANGNVVVPLSHDIGEDRLDCFETAEIEGWFSFDSQDGWTYETVTAKASHPLMTRLRNEREAGLIIFSSGTTGKRKASLLQISLLLEKFRDKVRPSFRTLIFLKLDHIGGINTLFSIMLNGGALITAEDRNAGTICQTIQQQRVALLPTTPTFLNMLLISGVHADYDLSSLEVITYGTETMPLSTLTAVNKAFPHVKLKQTYGLTELGIFSTKSRDNTSTWMKVGGQGIDLKIKDNTLWIRSASAMLGYLNYPSPFDEQGWYNTGDLVETDGEYLRILGRETDIINVGGEKVYPAEVESVLLEMDNIREAVVKGRTSPVTGHTVSVTLVLDRDEPAAALRKRMFVHCRNRLERFKIPTFINICETSLVSDRFKMNRASA